MDKEIYIFETETGEKIYMEAEAAPGSGGQVPASEGEDRDPRYAGKIKDAFSQVKTFAKSVIEILDEEVNPDELTIETGFKFNAKANCFIASSATEVAFKISLKWSKEK